jgi:hypothetical protein
VSTSIRGPSLRVEGINPVGFISRCPGGGAAITGGGRPKLAGSTTLTTGAWGPFSFSMALRRAVRSGDLETMVCVETASNSRMMGGCSRVADGSPA